MAINVVARKFLWGRAGNLCAWPGCDQRLIANTGDEEAGILESQGIIVGEEAHIRSSKANGPRYDAAYPAEQVDAYVNLILLCPTHHSVVDKEGGTGFPVETLVQMKLEHEKSVDRGRDISHQRRQQLEEMVAAQLAVWERKLGIETIAEWENLTFGLNRPIPRITSERFDRLLDLGRWLLARTWPAAMPRLKGAFDRHFSAIQALTFVISDQMVSAQRGWELNRPYKRLDRWDPPLYEELLRESEIGAITIRYLASEMARSANLVIAAVRDELEPLYRLDTGVILSRDGDGILVDRVVREEYLEWNWQAPPEFPSLTRIRDAIVEAAGPTSGRIGYVDHRALKL